MKQQKSDSNFYLLLKRYCIAVLLVGTAILFYACEDNEISKIKPIESTDNLPIMEATNFETLTTDSGQVRYFLKASKLLRFENEGKIYTEFPEGIELIKYDANKKITSSITANYAKQFLKEERWEAKNNVIVTNEKGDTLKTEHLILDEKKQKIETEEFVQIISKDKIINGIGLTSDLDMKDSKIWKVTGTMYVSANNTGSPSNQSLNNTTSPPAVEIPQQDSNRILQFK
ncbi:LPS export ABC transporter periplasmic protein LptC [Maribellus sp. YY47]|uniref:LPS export ABC transporter periplasmic protein LptC n=1 Tax=Maribellus sp. YY47 TaxID=2929486 RepID=UPI002000B64E|nr:LPS export ABC transporter periplasmic protein LptC [Maribellus sp. YY47]MCK3682510.1 LPS export ABC transporter periplasmic protein LptC [Maribellus sp. YY47]